MTDQFKQTAVMTLQKMLEDNETFTNRGTKLILEIPLTVEDDNGHSTIELFINPVAYAKMMIIVKNENVEAAWHGIIERPSPNVFHLQDILVYPQINSAALTTSTDEEYTEWLLHYLTAEDDTFEKMKFHGHSHVNMAVTPSSIDQQYRESILATLDKEAFYVFLIINKRQEVNVEIYDRKAGIVYENSDITVAVSDPYNRNTIKAWYAIEAEKLKKAPRSDFQSTNLYSDNFISRIAIKGKRYGLK